MNTNSYIRKLEAMKSERRAICARENQLISASEPLLAAVAEIDPAAEEKLRDIIALIAEMHPMRLAA